VGWQWPSAWQLEPSAQSALWVQPGWQLGSPLQVQSCGRLMQISPGLHALSLAHVFEGGRQMPQPRKAPGAKHDWPPMQSAAVSQPDAPVEPDEPEDPVVPVVPVEPLVDTHTLPTHASMAHGGPHSLSWVQEVGIPPVHSQVPLRQAQPQPQSPSTEHMPLVVPPLLLVPPLPLVTLPEVPAALVLDALLLVVVPVALLADVPVVEVAVEVAVDVVELPTVPVAWPVLPLETEPDPLLATLAVDVLAPAVLDAVLDVVLLEAGLPEQPQAPASAHPATIQAAHTPLRFAMKTSSLERVATLSRLGRPPERVAAAVLSSDPAATTARGMGYGVCMADSSPPATSSTAVRLLIGCGALVLGGFALFVAAIAYYWMARWDQPVTVQGLSWMIEQPVEVFGPVETEQWCDLHHDGYREVSRVKQSRTPDREDWFCTYAHDEWSEDHSIANSISGSGTQVGVLPELKVDPADVLAGRRRLGRRTETYQVELRLESGDMKYQTCELTLAMWKGLTVGQEGKAKAQHGVTGGLIPNFFGVIVDCDSLRF
jgi:hypothetical protein